MNKILILLFVNAVYAQQCRTEAKIEYGPHIGEWTDEVKVGEDTFPQTEKYFVGNHCNLKSIKTCSFKRNLIRGE